MPRIEQREHLVLIDHLNPAAQSPSLSLPFFHPPQGANGRKRRQAAENRAARARAETQTKQQQARQQEEQTAQQRQRRARTNSRARSARHDDMFDEFQDTNSVHVEAVLESLGPEGKVCCFLRSHLRSRWSLKVSALFSMLGSKWPAR